MQMIYFTEEKNRNFISNVIVALKEKAQDPKFSHLSDIADHMKKGMTTNLNRELRLAMRLNNAHCLNVKG